LGQPQLRNNPYATGGTLTINRDKLPDKEESENNGDDYSDYTCKSIRMQGELLLTRIWNKLHPTPEEVRLTSVYIMTYSFGEVETAFSEAVKYDRKRLAYVESICKKRKERADIAKKNELEKQKRIEQERKIEEQKKSGVGLGLIERVYGDVKAAGE